MDEVEEMSLRQATEQLLREAKEGGASICAAMAAEYERLALRVEAEHGRGSAQSMWACANALGIAADHVREFQFHDASTPSSYS